MKDGRVLVVDDELQIRRALTRALTGHGYQVELAEDGAAALDLLATRSVDVMVLDLMMPGIDGFEVLREVRTWSQVPIIVLSARGEEPDKVAALDMGADDYLTKPFGIEELLARLRAAQRRSTSPNGPPPPLVVGDVTIDLARHLITSRGERIPLTPTEYALLAVLAQHAGRVLTHKQLVERVWGRYSPQHDRQLRQQQQLRVYVAYLRRKLEADPTHPALILTEPGVGYRLWVDG